MKIKNSQSGFTLVEMIVSLAIFSIVAVVAVGALLKITDANRKAQTLQVAINNVNFAFESMTRELRVGGSYECHSTGAFNGSSVTARSCAALTNGSASTAGTTSIAFASSKTASAGGSATCNLVYAYLFAPVPGGWTINKAAQSACSDSISDFSYAPIMDPSVVVTSYNFGVSSSDQTSVSPRVFLHVAGYAGATERQRTYFNLQTTISQRI